MSRELAQLLKLEGIQDQQILSAIAEVPRDKFVDPELENLAYLDEALPIGYEQTISQPYVVARMTELLLRDHPCSRVLEIGTGSGYQSAILSRLVPAVYTVERIKALSLQAALRFKRLGYNNIFTLYGDGRLGWKEFSPYDGILVTASASEVPEPLVEQLSEGGRLVMPILSGLNYHELSVLTKVNNHLIKKTFDPVLFVPLRGGIED